MSEIVIVYALQNGIPRFLPDGDYRRRRRLTMRVQVGSGPCGKPDPDNLLKATLDGLKLAGLIVDDSSEWLVMEMPIVERAPLKQTIFTFEDI